MDIEQPHQVKYISLLTSAAHTYGNALAIAQKYIMDIFPKDTFKTVHVNSKIAHRQILSTPHEFLKKTKPIIIFRPRMEYNDDRFLTGTLITEKIWNNYNTGPNTELQPFFLDAKNAFNIKYTLNRYLMYLDVTMVFSTMIQQINYIHFLKNSIAFGIPFDIDCHLESYLPKEMMEIVSNLAGVPIKNEEGSVKPFMDYLNSNSVYPITYKLEGARNSEEWYRYYPAKILSTIMDLNADDGDRIGQVTSNYTVSFTMKMEFFGTGFNYLFSDKIHKIPKPSIPSDSSLIPVFTDVILHQDLNLAPGWQVFTHASVRLEKVHDSVDISSLLNNSIKEGIQYHIDNGIPLTEMIDIIIREQGELIEHGVDYRVNYDKLTIDFNNAVFGYHTYSIIIAINVHYINELIKEIFKLK